MMLNMKIVEDKSKALMTYLRVGPTNSRQRLDSLFLTITDAAH